MLPLPTEAVLEALAQVPTLPCLITTAFGEIRDGRLVDRVQQCGTQPPMLLVAMEKGHPLSPLIRDSRTFGLSMLDPNERLLQRIFGPDRLTGEDPFFTFPHRRGRLGAPIVTRATAWFDCEVVRHLDIDSDCELYVGLVVDAGLGEAPAHRLKAALGMTRSPGARATKAETARRNSVPAVASRRAEPSTESAAQSPAERTRSVPAIAKPAPTRPRRARGR